MSLNPQIYLCKPHWYDALHQIMYCIIIIIITMQITNDPDLLHFEALISVHGIGLIYV